MTLSVSVVDRQDYGNAERIVADVTFDTEYPWGGEPVQASTLGFRVNSKLFDVSGRDGKYVLEFVPDPALSSRATRNNRGNLLIRETMAPNQDVVLSTPLLAIGSSSKKEIKITNAVVGILNGGTSFELAAAEHAFAGAADDITADADTAQERYYLLSTTDGTNVAVTPSVAVADEGAATPPAIPSNAAAIGMVKIVVAAGVVDFDATSDDLDATHLTVTYEDLDQQVYHLRDLSGLTMRVVAHGR